MWGLWFGPLIVAIFLGSAVVSAGALAVSKPKNGRRLATALAAPIGCAALPIAAVALLGVIGKATQKSDSQLFEEMFGYRTALSDDRMLFDDFGGAGDREIFMRIEPDDGTWKRLQAIRGFSTSTMSERTFIAEGESHGLGWWIRTNTTSPGGVGETCDTIRIYHADDYRDWGQFRIAECLGGKSLFAASDSRRLFVIATRLPISG